MIRKVLLLVVLSLTMAGCASFRQMQVQGQRLTKEQVQAIHKGLTKEQVIGRLGSPVLQAIYDPNTLIYVLVVTPRLGRAYEERMVIHLHHNHVVNVATNRI